MYRPEPILVTTFLTFFAGVGSLKIVLGLQQVAADVSGAMVLFIVRWIPYAALMLIPPFILAAGVQLYFMDKRQLDKVEAPWDDKFLVLLSLFIGAFCLGILPPVAGMALESGTENPYWLLQAFPLAWHRLYLRFPSI